ncbi:tetrapyrrole methylase [Mycotypha africana]|uniref:tetrapyrrole methylase n=1 Tax=Mycotypha africana TaxID=64632 RepID=UPI0023012EA6|nr:tetrapyrrole methylase [Mycotypha africana]KAI8971869.1 tetrapyrrole methylase [Mycotypha africana]
MFLYVQMFSYYYFFMADYSRIPQPQGGASLMIAFQSRNKNVIIIGHNTVAASRVFACLEADANVYLVADPKCMCTELAYRVEQRQITLLSHHYTSALLDNTQCRFDLGFVCGTVSTTEAFRLTDSSTEYISQQFKQHGIPVNVTDRPDLSDFFMTSTYRDQSVQISVSTNGQASKLSNRIRRHITSNLPARLGDAVQRVGVLRKKVRAVDPSTASGIRRMKWLAQICEYWSMERLAQLSDKDMEELLETYHDDEGYESLDTTTDNAVRGSKKLEPLSKGSITLVGAGTGDPDLLTIAAYKAIEEADLILSDKIVPEEVLKLVKCDLKIARKFPGNADAAQEEFNKLALKAIHQGKKVVRLKQGDPYLFGRGGEEVLFFRNHGITPRVIPGISSTVAAGLLAGIPLTHRSVASQFLVTTGTGAHNSAAPLPKYDKHRTDVFLMAIHRLEMLVKDLISTQKYPADIPCAIVERASCKDQRVIWGTLSNISDVLRACGGSRPPGLLIVGHAINVLKHENKGTEGVAASLMSASGTLINNLTEDIKSDGNNSHLLTLHDPECVL